MPFLVLLASASLLSHAAFLMSIPLAHLVFDIDLVQVAPIPLATAVAFSGMNGLVALIAQVILANRAPAP